MPVGMIKLTLSVCCLVIMAGCVYGHASSCWTGKSRETRIPCMKFVLLFSLPRHRYWRVTRIYSHRMQCDDWRWLLYNDGRNEYGGRKVCRQVSETLCSQGWDFMKGVVDVEIPMSRASPQ